MCSTGVIGVELPMSLIRDGIENIELTDTNQRHRPIYNLEISSMPGPINSIEGGTVTTAQGFSAGATYAGLKTFAEDKLDLALIVSETLCFAAGVFTTSTIKSPTITVNREHLALSQTRAIIVNAGIANTAVGVQGYKDAQEMTVLAAKKINAEPAEMLVCSTGVIGVTEGFSAGATYAGLKTFAEDKLDLALIVSETLCSAAGVFTTSTIKSPTITVNREHLALSKTRAIIVNAGIANTAVGVQGYKDAQEMTVLAAKKINAEPAEMLVCSTGVIGVELPMSLIRDGIEKIELTDNGGHDVARAMMTTDTRPKEVAVSFETDGRRCHPWRQQRPP